MNIKKLDTNSVSKFLPFVYSKPWSTLLLAGIVLLTTLYSCSRTKESAEVTGEMKQKSEATKIVLFGGTVTEGTSAKLDLFHDCFKHGTNTVNKVRETQTWWSILERILTDWVDGEVEIICSGLAGNTVAKGAARLEYDVLSHSPDYVLVMFGMDDVLASVDAENFREDLEKVVNRIEEEKINIVLLTPPPVSERMTVKCTMEELRLQQDHLYGLVQAIHDLAEEKKLPLIDFYKYFKDNHLAYDHLFEGWLPDAVAQSAMAPFVAGKLLPVMGVKNYPNPTLCDYRKIYSDAEKYDIRHNGFTDLTFFQGEFYAAFRSGRCHGLSGGGFAKIIVLRSQDGVKWIKDAELHVEGFIESRDPKFLQVENRLMLYGPCWPVEQKSDTYWVSYGFERLNTGKWSDPFRCSPYVFWRLKKWRDQYVVAGFDRQYNEDSKQWHYGVKLLNSPDGHTWEATSTILDYETDGNETDLLIDGDKLMAYARCGDGSDQEMLIATYITEENRWESVATGRTIQAPCVFKVKGKTMITGRYCSQSDEGFRDLRRDWNAFTSGKNAEMVNADPARVEAYHHGLRTGIFIMDGTRPRLLMELLSAGDSSYPGVVQYGNEYLISDYSMHEYYPEIKRPGDWQTPCDIYLSRIRF